MSYREQDTFFATAYNTGTDAWTSIPFERRATEIASHLPKGAMVLDIGAGRGNTLYELAELGLRAIGLENNTQLVEKGNEEVKAKGLGESIRFFEGTALDIPFTTGSFDAVIDIGLLHHLKPEDFYLYIEEVARVLKQGGVFFISALSKKTQKYLNWNPSGEQSDFERDGVRYHFFSHEELQSLLRNHFEIEEFAVDMPHGEDDAHFAVVIVKKK